MATEIQNPISTATEQATAEDTSFSTLGETDFEELATEIQNPISTTTEQATAEEDLANAASFLTTESNNPIESTVEQEIIVPTFEDEEELEEIKEEQPQDNVPNLEEFISAQEKTEATDVTYSGFNFESQAEKSNEEKPIDVKFATSETKENSSSSIDDFLADLDNSMDKPAEEK